MIQSLEGPEEPLPDATFQSLFGCFSVGDTDIMTDVSGAPSSQLLFTNLPFNVFGTLVFCRSPTFLMKPDAKRSKFFLILFLLPSTETSRETKMVSHSVTSGARPANQRQESTTVMRWATIVPSVCRTDKQTARPLFFFLCSQQQTG